jgi:hypothetical protein
MKTLSYIVIALLFLKVLGFIELSWFWILLPVILPVSLISAIGLIAVVGTTMIAYKLIKNNK